jgi:lipid-binding SYLF domain-containing protein
MNSKKSSLQRNLLRVALLAASVFVTHSLGAQSAPVARYNNGVPRPPGAIALDQLNRLSAQPHTQALVEDRAQAAAAEVKDALAFYHSLQQNPATAVSADVIKNAKSIVIIDQWSGGVVAGASGGSAIALMKKADGTFSSPVFYSVAGASIGPRLGVSHIRTLALVMTDKAAKELANGKTVSANGLRAVASTTPTSQGVATTSPDLLVYQTASGVDVGAFLASTSLAPDTNRNKAYYRFLGESPDDIIAGNVPAPDEARMLVAAINQSTSREGMLARTP